MVAASMHALIDQSAIEQILEKNSRYLSAVGERVKMEQWHSGLRLLRAVFDW
jgi:hypothetical protein